MQMAHTSPGCRRTPKATFSIGVAAVHAITLCFIVLLATRFAHTRKWLGLRALLGGATSRSARQLSKRFKRTLVARVVVQTARSVQSAAPATHEQRSIAAGLAMRVWTPLASDRVNCFLASGAVAVV